MFIPSFLALATSSRAPDERPLHLTSSITFSDSFEMFGTHIYEIEIK